MALAIDTSRQLRSIGELGELVQAISAAPATESEPDWLEWKREADLTERRWHAQLAKFIAGFANREPAVANQNAGGCAYLVIGVEPGNVSGVSPIDNAILDAGISRFVRTRWSPQYVGHKGKQILVITVEPPERGSRIAAMLTAYTSSERGAFTFRKGDVFLRRHGRTELAEQDDYDMLVERFAADAEEASGMTVEPLTPVAAVPVACSSDEVTAWCAQQSSVLLGPLEKQPQHVFSGLLDREYRRPGAYRDEVVAYIKKAASLLRYEAHARALANRVPGMQLVLSNETEHNFVAARVEVTIDGEVWAYRREQDARSMMPTPPSKWGLGVLLDPSAIGRIGPTSGPYIDNSEPTHIEFDDVDLRPRGRVRLGPVHLVSDAALAGKTVTARWTATSTSVSGVASGEFLVRVSLEVVSPLSQ